MTQPQNKLHVTYTHEDDLIPPQEPVDHRAWQQWGAWASALALIVLATYLPMLGGKLEPVFQDDLNLRHNPFLLTPRGWFAIWRYPHLHFQQFSPLGYSLFWIEMQLPRTISEWFRMNAPFEYLRLTHFLNIVLHLGNAMLLWTLLKKLEIRGAWLAAAIFAAHPLQVQSVAWMSQQPLLLGTFLGLCCVIVYLRYCGVNPMPFNPLGYFKLPETPWILYTLSITFLLLAVLAKPWMAIIPFVILVLIWWERSGITPSDIKRLSPLLVISIATVVAAIFFLSRDVRGVDHAEGLGPLAFVAASGRAMWTYLLMIVVPHPLAFAYPRWDMSHLLWLQLLYPAAILIALTILFVLRRRLGRGIFASGLLLVLSLLPAVVYFDQTNLRGAFIANSCAYLAVAVVAGGGCSIAVGRVVPGNPAPARLSPEHPAFVVAVLAIISLVLLGIFQSLDYQNPEKLWSHALERYPDAHFARIERAQLKLQVRDTDAASREFRTVLNAEPGNRRAMIGHASILQSMGENEKALGAYLAILRKNPRDIDAQIQSALCYLNLGDSRRALEITHAVLADNPDNIDAYNNLAVIAQARGEYDQALRHLNKAVELAPTMSGPRLNRANLYFRSGDLAAAEADITAVVTSQPNSFEAWFNAASMCASVGIYDRAEVFYRTALHIRPDSAIAHANLGKLLVLSGKNDEALFAFKQACTINPENAEYQRLLQRAVDQARIKDGARGK